jgi:pimeloyl-ACP methyl ester carboxylesterase
MTAADFDVDSTLDLDLSTLHGRLSTDAEFGLAVKGWNCRLVLDMGTRRIGVEVRDGSLAEVAEVAEGESAPPDLRDLPDLVYRAPPDDWAKLLRWPPPPGYVSLPFDDRHAFGIDGDRRANLFPYYGAVSRLVAIMRQMAHGPATTTPLPPPGGAEVVGRYLPLTVAGVEHRVYYEESGTGIPLVLLHTAGADARQWRHLLADAELAERFRIIAYDLPFHGRSVPPSGTEWWTVPYELTTEMLVDVTVGLFDGLGLDKPVFMGCSIGGHFAADLAVRHGDRLRAAIAINGAVHSPNDPALVASWADPTIGSQWRAAAMYEGTVPTSPEALRRETAWVYGQGAQGVFVGDIQYWARHHDLRSLPDDTDAGCPVHVLVGEYDRLRQYDLREPPTGPVALARKFRNATLTVMGGLGHFAPAENPAAFRAAVTPFLDAIERGEPFQQSTETLTVAEFLV